MHPWRELRRPEVTGYRQPDNSDTEFAVDFFTLHARPKPSDRILALGCSDLNALAALAESGPYKVIATDPSHLRLDAVERLARERSLDIDCVKAEQRRCPQPDESFDAVAVLGDSLAQPNDLNQPAVLLSEAKRLLRPGAALVLSIADGDWRRRHFLGEDVEMLPDGFVYRRSELSEDGERLITHEFVASQELGLATERLSIERLLGAEQILGMLNRCGFEATSFCKRAPTHRLESLFSPLSPPRLYFGSRKRVTAHNTGPPPTRKSDDASRHDVVNLFNAIGGEPVT